MATTAPPPVDEDPFRPTPIAVPATSPQRRAPGVLDQRRRVALADRIAELVSDADRHHRADDAPPCASRERVVAARGRLLDLEHALRSGIPITRYGEHLTEGLIYAVEARSYADGDPRALHDAAESACLAIGSVSPFH